MLELKVAKRTAFEGGRFRFLPPSKLPLIETTKAGAAPAFDSPRHGAKKDDVLLTRENRGGHYRPCEEACSETDRHQISTPEGRFSRGGNPLLNRFKDRVQGKGNRNPFPWRAFSFCPLSLCTSKDMRASKSLIWVTRAYASC